MAIKAEASAGVRANKGFHPFLDQPLEQIFVDTCMQAWPDADYANAHRHGCAAYAVTAWWPHAPVEAALEGLMTWRLITRQNANLILAESASDIRDAHATGRSALIVASQDGGFIGDRLHRLEAFHELGLRMLIPAYNANNGICGGCLDSGDVGLSRFGELVVDECNRLGIVLDCTHLSRRATFDIMERSSDPVVFSHSNVGALVPSPRNIDDAQIKACIERGGVIGLAPFGPLTLKPGATDWPTLDDFAEHIDHIAQLAGTTSNIAIGTDMSLGTYPYHVAEPWGEPAYESMAAYYSENICGDVRSPMRALKDFNAYSDVVTLISRLGSWGYDDTSVRGILGENILRIFDEVWR